MFQIQVFLHTMCPDLYYVNCIFSITQEVVKTSLWGEKLPHTARIGTSATLPPGGWTVTRVWTITTGGCKDY